MPNAVPPPPPPRLPAPARVNWSRNHELFRKFLTTGFCYQRYVADFLLCHGIPVQLPRMQFSPGSSQKFKDAPDLIAAGRILEVKSTSKGFVTWEDLPSDVVLDTIESWESKIRKPMAYVLVSQPTGAMLWTEGNSRSGWGVLDLHDSKRDIDISCYTVPRRRLMTMVSLVAELKKLPNPKLADHAMPTAADFNGHVPGAV